MRIKGITDGMVVFIVQIFNRLSRCARITCFDFHQKTNQLKREDGLSKILWKAAGYEKKRTQE
jgi:hypothetical protein